MPSQVIAAFHRIGRELTASGGPFELTVGAVNGSATRLFARAHANLAEFYAETEAGFGTASFIAEGEQSWSYAQIFAAARRLGAALQDRFGIGRGDRVGIVCRNRMEWIVAFLAITRIGAIAVLFNGRSSAPELAEAAAVTVCKVVIADGKRVELARQAGIDVPIIGIIEGRLGGAATVSFDSLVSGSGREAEAVQADADDPAAILFTSGTTGSPKGAVLSHRNICMLAANSQYLAALGMTLTAEQMGVPVDALRSRMPRLVSLLIFPLFHISGLTSLIMTMLSGGQVVTIRRWDPPAAMAEIEAKRINFLTGPALVLSDLLDLPGAAERLRYVINIGVGGQATPASLARRIKEAVPNAQDGNGWGMTELSGSVSAAKGALFDAKPDSCGFLSPLMEVRTVDDHGNVLHPGEIGELQLRGPLVMLGYWGKEAETAAILKDGWLSTGDIGRIDEDGFLYLADRKKDIVISAGENIFCAEVERVITSDQRVAEVAMFGVPDARLGERAIAVINLRPGQTCSSDEMAGLIAGRLADYKVPSEFVFDLGPIPRNAIGKIDKARLRDAYFAQARS